MKSNHFLSFVICFTFVACNQTIKIESLSEDIKYNLKNKIEEKLVNSTFSIKLQNNKCLNTYRTSPGFFTPQPVSVNCDQYGEYEKVDAAIYRPLPSTNFSVFKSTAINEPVFLINSGGFKENLYVLSSLTINKKCEVEKIRFENRQFANSNEINYPTTELSLVNDELFKGERHGLISASLLDKKWNVQHSNDESRFASSKIFKTIGEVIKSTTKELQSLDDSELKEMGLSQKLLKACL